MKRTCCLHNCGCCKLLLIINSSEPRASNGNEEKNGKTENKKQKKSAFVCTAALTDVRQISEAGVTSLKQQGGGKQTRIGICFFIPAPRSTSHWAKGDGPLDHRTEHPQSNCEYQQERRTGRFRGGATTSQGQRPTPRHGCYF